MATVTDADVQEWLERYADTWIRDGQIMPGLLPGTGEVGIRAQVSDWHLTPENMYERVEIAALEFYCTWLGLEFTTTRQPPKASGTR